MLSEERLNAREDSDYVSILIYEIKCIYTDKQNVVCEIQGHKYRLKEHIYELRNILSHDIFVQISQSPDYIKLFLQLIR